MAKILTIRLPDEQAAWLAAFAKASRLSQNRSVDAILSAAQERGWDEYALIPAVSRDNAELV